jgi:GR25 family glycosyltransferase involved in LPS biosynthesis
MLYYINMNKSNDRKVYMEKQCKDSHHIQRVIGVDGYDPSKLSINDISMCKHGMMKCSLSEIGCTTSHLHAIEKAYQNTHDSEHAIILEDDVDLSMFHKHYDTLFNIVLPQLPSNWECVQLCIMNGPFAEYLYKDQWTKKKILYVPWTRRHWGTQAYIVNKRGMQRIHDQFFFQDRDCCCIPTDPYLKQSEFVADAFIYNNLNTFTTTRPFVSVANYKLLPSTIHTHHSNIQRRVELLHASIITQDTIVTTEDIVDSLYENEKNEYAKTTERFNKTTTKKKFLFLRCRQGRPSWECDTTQLWGPDTDADYLIDVVTQDGNKERNYCFLSADYKYVLEHILSTDMLAYSSNEFNIKQLTLIIDKLKPSTLFHLSDEYGTRPEFYTLFSTIPHIKVFRQYAFPSLYTTLLDNVYHIPLGYHSWGRNYSRDLVHRITVKRPFKWCFGGSMKGQRYKLIQSLRNINYKHVVGKTKPFEAVHNMYEKSEFAICPPGNHSLETYRIYEAMFSGCVPIVIGNTITIEELKHRYSLPLPCLFATSVDNVCDIIQTISSQDIAKHRLQCLQWLEKVAQSIRETIKLI